MKGKSQGAVKNKNEVKLESNVVSIVQKPAEMLLVGSCSNDPFSTIVVDPRTGVATWSYKGSDLQGATSGIVRPLGSQGDQFIISIKEKPMVHVIAIHARDKFHQKSVIGGPITAFCTSNDGKLLFAAIRTQIHIWLLSTGELLSVTDAHYQTISHLELSEDGATLFSAAKDGAIHVYIVSDLISCDRDTTVAPIRKWRAHALAVRGMCVTFGRDPRVASCGSDHIASVHSVSLDACILKVSADRPLTSCAIDPAESRLFVGTDLGNIVQINLYAMGAINEILVQSSDERNEKVPVFNGHSEEICSLAVNGDGSLLASGDISGRYCIWDISSRQPLKVSSMRGPVGSLQFIPNWNSLSASEHFSLWRPNFELQRNPTTGSTIPMTSSQKDANNLEKWRDFTDNLIERLMSENDSLSNGLVKNGKKGINKPTIPLEGSTGPNSGNLVTYNPSMSTDERIKELEKEVSNLKRVNAELYAFAAQEISKDD